MNHEYRSQLLERIKSSLFKWLGMRRTFSISMIFTSSIIENGYVDQFRYSQHVVFREYIMDAMAMFIISHCRRSCIAVDSRALYWTSIKLSTISEYCPNLKLLQVSNCDQIKDASIIYQYLLIGLQSLNLRDFCQLTDISIIIYQ